MIGREPMPLPPAASCLPAPAAESIARCALDQLIAQLLDVLRGLGKREMLLHALPHRLTQFLPIRRLADQFADAFDIGLRIAASHGIFAAHQRRRLRLLRRVSPATGHDRPFHAHRLQYSRCPRRRKFPPCKYRKFARSPAHRSAAPRSQRASHARGLKLPLLPGQIPIAHNQINCMRMRRRILIAVSMNSGDKLFSRSLPVVASTTADSGIP